MNELLNFLLAVTIILIAAKTSGYISVRLGQPSVLGELVVGLLLGPTVLNLFGVLPGLAGDDHLTESLTLFAEIGVLLLMFLAGLELELNELLKSGRVAGLSGSLGVIVPLAGGYVTALLFGLSSEEALFIGLALSATSVSISAQVLIELGVLRSKVGLGMLGAAVFDDILVVLLLSVASTFFDSNTAGAGSIGMIAVKMVLYIVGATVVGLYLVPPLLSRISDLPVSKPITAFALVVCLLFAWASEALGGVAAITGAFLAGLFMARTPFVRQIDDGISTLAYGFFVPIFLVNIGLQANLREISSNLWVFAIVLTIVAAATKVIGSGGGALMSGFGRLDALRLGVGMISRGEVGLIVASVALSQGHIQSESFSVIVFMVIVATLVTPLLLRWLYHDNPTDEEKPQRKPGRVLPASGDVA